MAKAHQCGPEHDREFFAELHEVMLRHPQLLGKYQIKCVDHETDILNINFDEQVRISRIEGSRIVGEFTSRLAIQGETRECCEWCGTDGGYRCCGYWIRR
jgi:hypothetical protein